MASVTLTPQAFATTSTFQGQSLQTVITSYADPYTCNGDVDGGLCIKVSGDGKDITASSAASTIGSVYCYFQDTLIIPNPVVITNVQLSIRAKGVNMDLSSVSFSGMGLYSNASAAGFVMPTGTLGAAYSTISSAVMTVNPVTLNPWARSDLFSDSDAGSFGDGGWQIGSLQVTGGAATSFGLDYASLIVTYVAGLWYFNPVTNSYQFGADPGAPWILQDPHLNITRGGSAGVFIYRSGQGGHRNVPASGSTAGGQVITLYGTGFGVGMTVTIGGTTATTVTVVDSTTAIVVTPVHAPGVVTVTVTNQDGSTSSAVDAFTYYTPAQWRLHRCDLKPRSEQSAWGGEN